MNNRLNMTSYGNTHEVNQNSSFDTIFHNNFTIYHFLKYEYDFFNNKFKVWFVRQTDVITPTNYQFRCLVKIDNDVILDDYYSTNASSIKTSLIKEIDCNFDGSFSNISFYLSNRLSSVSPSSFDDYYISSLGIKCIKIKTNNIWKKSISFIKKNGIWKRCIVWKKINGIWKKGS